MNLAPTSTGSATAIALIFPELKGKLNGLAVRVPLTNSSITDCVFEVRTHLVTARPARSMQQQRQGAAAAARRAAAWCAATAGTLLHPGAVMLDSHGYLLPVLLDPMSFVWLLHAWVCGPALVMRHM